MYFMNPGMRAGGKSRLESPTLRGQAQTANKVPGLREEPLWSKEEQDRNMAASAARPLTVSPATPAAAPSEPATPAAGSMRGGLMAASTAKAQAARERAGALAGGGASRREGSDTGRLADTLARERAYGRR